MREVKKASSHFINENKFTKAKFYWQEGYGAFSYSHSALDSVINYIHKQKEHHKKVSFKEEYIVFLDKFQIDFKEEFLFDWID